jgi:hypothetical protein
MKRVEAILAACLALSLTGCVLRGKQPVAKATMPPKPVEAPPPAPPPKPLSTPQTDVELPAYQPLTPEAIASTFPPEEPPPAPPAPKPPSRSRQQNTTPRPVEVTPQGPPTPAAPATTTTTTTETERPRIQDALSPEELKRLQDEAEGTKREIKQRIDAIQVHRLNRQQNVLVKRIRTFVDQSDDAQHRGDMRQAAELAKLALVLAKELQP